MSKSSKESQKRQRVGGEKTKAKDGDKKSRIMKKRNEEDANETNIQEKMDLNVTELINKLDLSKEDRKKLEVQSHLENIHERIKFALQNADMGTEIHCTPSEIQKISQIQSRPPGFDAKAKRKKIRQQQTMLTMIKEFLSNCEKRRDIMLEISDWLQANASLEDDLPVPDEIVNEEKELSAIHRSILEAFDYAHQTGETLKSIGLKLMEDAGYSNPDEDKYDVSRKKRPSKLAPSVSTDIKHQIHKEEELLSDIVIWQKAAKDVRTVLEESLRQIRGLAFKNNLRYAIKQFNIMNGAMVKRSEDCEQKVEENVEMGMKIGELITTLEQIQTEQVKMTEEKNALNLQIVQHEKMTQAQASLVTENTAAQTDVSGPLVKESSSSVRSAAAVEEKANSNLKDELCDYKEELTKQRAQIMTLQKNLKAEQEKVEKLGARIEFAEKLKSEKTEMHSKLDGEMSIKLRSLNDENESLERQVVRLKTELACKNEMLEFQEQRLKEMMRDDKGIMNAIGELAGQMGVPKGEQKDKETKPLNQNVAHELKRIVTKVKKECDSELSRLKDHLEKEKQRKDAEIRRLENIQKEQLLHIHKESVRLLRAINRFKESVAQILSREDLPDAAYDVQCIPNLNTDEAPSDPKSLLSQMAGHAVEMLVALEFKLSQSLMNKRLEIKANSIAKSFATKDLEQQVVATKKAKQMSEELMEKFVQVKEKLAVSENILKEIKDREDLRYQTLTDRYKMLWKQYKTLQSDMCKLQSDCEASLKNKEDMLKLALAKKQNMEKTVEAQDDVITRMQMNIKQKCIEGEKSLQLSLQDQKRNLAALEKALKDNNISHDLYEMTVGLIKKMQILPLLRFRHLVDKYVAHCKLKSAKGKLEKQLDSHIPVEKKSEIQMYISKVDKKMDEISSNWKTRIDVIEKERKHLFEEMSSRFSDLLTLNGLALALPAISQKSQITSPLISRRFSHKRSCFHPMLLPRLDGSKSLIAVGTGLPYPDSTTRETFWKVSGSMISSIPLRYDIPRLMDLDINRSMRDAKRSLTKQRQLMKMSHVSSVDYTPQDLHNLSHISP